MGIAMVTTVLARALVIHAVVAPVIFAILSFAHSRVLGYGSPLKTALVFIAIVVVMDIVVVTLMIERSLKMFASPLGTWIPFALIFLSSWVTGVLVALGGRE